MDSRRRWLWLSLVPILLCVGVGAGAWLAGSETALRFIARHAEGLSGGRVTIQGVHGSLYGPLRIDALDLQGETKRFQVRDLRIDWSPRALWQRHLRISQLELAELRITEIKPSVEPLQLPDSLGLPLSLEVPEARIDRLVIKAAGGEWTLRGIEFGLHKPAQTYRLDLRRLATPWGTGQARVDLADSPPFALSGQATFLHASGNITASAAGQLERVNLKAAARVAGGEGTADLLITPFAKRPLRTARINAQGMDPAVWDKSLPKAGLSLAAELHSQGEQDFAGTFTLRNSQPGPLNRSRLPVREVAARVSGTVEGMALHELRLDLARAGRFTGTGRVVPDKAVLDLETRDFDPQGVHDKLRSLRLAGNIHVQADPEAQHLLADLGYQGYRLHLDAEHHARVLHIQEALLSSGGGSLALYGTLGLDADQPFDLAGALSGFDPAAFGAYPAARVNASFSAMGRLAPGPQARLSFAVADSHFRHQPLAGQGNLRLAEGRLWDSDAVLRLGDNRLALQGAFGKPGDRLKLQLQARQLGVINTALAGRLEASGEIAGSLAAPSGHLDVQADSLSWGGDYHLGSLRAKASLDHGLDGNLSLDAQLAGLRSPQLELGQARVQAQGRRSQHTLNIAARHPGLDLTAELAGAWREQGGKASWAGQVLKLANQGRYPLTLLGPARLELGTDTLRLASARFAILDAVFNVQEAAYRTGVLISRGEFKGVSPALWKKWPDWPEEISGDLVLGGAWRIDAGEKMNGHVSLARERGDLVLAVPGQPSTAMGLKHLSLLLDAKDDRIQASLEADGLALGHLRAKGESRLSRREGVWGIAGDAPLQASADITLQSLAWAAPFVDKSGGTLFDGSLTAQVQASGTLAAPRLTGTVAGERFRLALPEQGLNLKDGRFQAALNQNSLELKSLSLRGDEGILTGQGRLGLRGSQPGLQPNMQLSLKADKLKVLSRPDRLLILSGDGSLALDGNKLRLTAQLKADRGVFELAGEDAPTLSEDVVVLGRDGLVSAKGMPYAVDMNLDLNLGDRFFLKGQGLDAQLGGAVKLTGRQGLPLRGNGSIRVVKGAYSAYGQKLDIERGNLNFQGPLDNPGLNIVGLRKNQEVEAGVAITGTAQVPVVKLVSNPTVSDSEKLSWLVLGHGLSETGAQEFDALQLAAGALLGAGESVTLQQRIAHAAGLEEVSLKGAGSLETAVLTLGKRLSSRAYLSYEQGLAGTETLVKINYTFSRRVSLRAQAGTTPAVDLFYTFSFD